MSRRRVGAIATFAVVTWWVAAMVPACLSPTLPVPPPNAPGELQEPLAQLQSDGRTIQISGTDAQPGSLVHLWNEETQNGDIVRADSIGRYQTVLAVDLSCAIPRNHVALWQMTIDGVTSGIKTYRLPNMFGAALPPENDVRCTDAGLIDGGEVEVGTSPATDADDIDDAGGDGAGGMGGGP